MPDNNAAIILTLILIFLVIGFAAYHARSWIKKFTHTLVQAKAAQRAESEICSTRDASAAFIRQRALPQESKLLVYKKTHPKRARNVWRFRITD